MSNQPNIMKERDIRRKQVLNIGDKVVLRKLCKQMQDKYEGKVGTIIEKVRLTRADDDIAYGLYFGRDDVVDKISFPLIGLPEKIGKTAVVAPFFAEDLVKVEDDKHKDEPRFGKIVIPVEADIKETEWDVYRHILAHDIAVKVVDKNTVTTVGMADYVTAFANKIVENLKEN